MHVREKRLVMRPGNKYIAATTYGMVRIREYANKEFK